MNVRGMTLGLLLATGVSLVGGQSSHGEQPAAESAPRPLLLALLAEPEKDQDEAEKKTDESEEPKIDRFAVPDGDVAELLKFLAETMEFRPKTREEFLQFRVRGNAAMKEAAEKIMAQATEEDKKLPGFENVEPLLLSFRAKNRDASDEDRAKLLDDLKAYLSTHEEPSKHAINAARSLAIGLEYGGKPAEAIVVYNELGSILARKPDEQIARTGIVMEGAARRLDLPGKKLEVSGTEIDGSKFDWEKLRGKVVLVDFWATWCGPCLAELPNVRKNYELYHDKGFEVVAISLDRDREALEKFLAEEQTPWITLHDGDWKDNDVATSYGIMGIPTVILVDKEGKVLSTRARGEALGELLAEQLGPVEESKDDDQGDEQGDAEDGDA